MSTFDHAFQAKPAKTTRELRHCEPPAFKPIGISSVRAVLEQMRERSTPKPTGAVTPAARHDDPWAA